MKQINCTVSGLVTDTPYLTIDNGHIYWGTFETPTRCLFFYDESEPQWGYTIFYGGKAIRGIIPAEGSVEGPLLEYAPTLPRLTTANGLLYENGRRWTWAMMTGFLDYQLWLDGRLDQLRSVWTQARDFGCNGRRILGMAYYINRFDPSTYGNRYFSEMAPFALEASKYGQRLHWDVFADNQVYQLGNDFWQNCLAQLEPLESVIIGAGNEWPKNGFDPTKLQRPSVLASQGSTTADAAPPMPGWGVRMFHGRRDYPKVFMSFDDAVYVGRGLDSDGKQYAPVAAIAHDEPMGFAEIDITNRRSTDPRLAECLMLTGKAYGVGATFHSEDGIFSRLLGPRQQECARAFFAAK